MLPILLTIIMVVIYLLLAASFGWIADRFLNMFDNESIFFIFPMLTFGIAGIAFMIGMVHAMSLYINYLIIPLI